MTRTRLVVLSLFAALLLVAPAAHGTSPGLVLSQVYPGGGNSGATFTNERVHFESVTG